MANKIPGGGPQQHGTTPQPASAGASDGFCVHWFSLGQEKPTLCLARSDNDLTAGLLQDSANILDRVLFSFDHKVCRAKDIHETELDESAQCVTTLRQSAQWANEYHAVELGLKSITAVGWGSNRRLRQRTAWLALALALICERNDVLQGVCVDYPRVMPLAIRCLEMKKDKAPGIIPANMDGTAPQASTSGL
jgi:hypothetical protein